MIDMSAAMEVDQWLQSNLCGDIFFVFCGCELLGGSIEAVDIGLVVVLVVKLHDLSGDGGLERTVII
jgi:hypothetical protein